MTDVI